MRHHKPFIYLFILFIFYV